MAAMTMDQREPEVAKFIDTYKYDQEMSSRRNKFGGGTSLPLNSDGYEDKQRALRDERHRDWMVQQEKPQAIRNAIFMEQRQMEQQKMEERHRSPPRPVQPQGPQMDYNLASEQARAEERRSYQNHMGKYQYAANAAPKPTFDYEENKKILNEERKREYNQLMEKKAQEERYVQMHGRPVTPPGGLNIGAYDRQMKETAEEKKRQYKEMLDQQQKEHMYLRARQEPEMAVIDRNALSQHPTNKPPPGPGYNRPRDETEQQQRRRNEERHQQQISKPAEVVKNQYYSSDDYEKFQKEIQRKQSEEYRDFLAKKAGETRNREWNFDQAGVLELHGDDAVQSRQRELRAERQKEYNSYISQQKVKNPERRHEFVDTASGPFGGLFQGLGEHGNRSEMLNKERQREYNESTEHNAGKEKVSGRPNWARETLPNDTDRGRGSPMKTQPPPDQYEQMLDEKRREEASRRRYDDPEYRGRLVDSRERERDGGQRYSNY